MGYPELKQRAIQLRQKGYSYNLIAEKVGVSKSTLHLWLQNVAYTPNELVVGRIGSARAKSGEVKTRQKQECIKKAYRIAQSDVGVLTRRDIFMLGIGLYIGEGEKGINTRIVSSDPRIILFAVRWFKSACGVTKENFKLAIHLYPDNNIKECLRFWSETVGIPQSQFGKTQIDSRKGKKMAKRGKLSHGTAHLRVRSLGKKEHGVFLHRRIMGWMDHILDAGLV